MQKCLIILLLTAVVHIAIGSEHLGYGELEEKLDLYEKALREQMRPNSLSDTILLIRKLDMAAESEPKNWDWKLRSNANKTVHAIHDMDEDALRALTGGKSKIQQLRLGGNDTTINLDKIKKLESKLKDQNKIYKKTLTKYEKPVIRFQTRRQRRRKLRQQIAQKLFGPHNGSSLVQMSPSLLQQCSILVFSAYKVFNYNHLKHSQ